MSYHHGNLKEALIQTGDELLKTYGPDGFSLRDIAKSAGVSHNAPYRHFLDKNDFIEQIITRTLSEIADQILSAPLIYPASITLQIQFVGRLWMHQAIQYPKKAFFIFTSPYNPAQIIILQNLCELLESEMDRSLSLPSAQILISGFRGLGLDYIAQTQCFNSSDIGLTPQSSDDLLALSDLFVEKFLLSTVA
jgi:AcrR family transcriptional regulator